MAAGDKCLNLHIRRNVEHPEILKKDKHFAIAVFLGHQNETWEAAKEEIRRFLPTGVACEASGAHEFLKLQLGLFSKMSNTPEI